MVNKLGFHVRYLKCFILRVREPEIDQSSYRIKTGCYSLLSQNGIIFWKQNTSSQCEVMMDIFHVHAL